MLDGDARFKPLPTPPAMEHELYTFQEAGHGWLRLLGDLGIGCVLADDMGLGKTVQAIAMIVSEREQYGADALGPTLVVCPMSVARQWMHEVERFAPTLRRAPSPRRRSPRRRRRSSSARERPTS